MSDLWIGAIALVFSYLVGILHGYAICKWVNNINEKREKNYAEMKERYNARQTERNQSA